VSHKYRDSTTSLLAKSTAAATNKKDDQTNQQVAKKDDGGAKPDVNFKFETATEETCFEERAEKDGVTFIRTGGTIHTQSRFTYSYTGEEDPMETFAKFFGTTDIFSLLVNVKDDDEDAGEGGNKALGDADTSSDGSQKPANVTVTSVNVKPKICSNCSLPIKTGTTVVFEDKPFHEGCFKCEGCFGELSSIFKVDGKRYCEDCHTDKFCKICATCTKPVKGACTIFREKPYHQECLCCEECKKPFEGSSVMAKEDKLYCQDCHVKNFGSVCAVCSKIVTGLEGSEGIEFGWKKYHRSCFVCKKCKLGYPTVRPVYTKEKDSDEHYCSECYDSAFSEKCMNCKKLVSVADESGSVGTGDQQWHKKCFNCKDCGKSLLGTKVSIVGDQVSCGTKCKA